MPEDFYPIPPSFGALMKRQGAERNFADEVKTLNSYTELEKRFGDLKGLTDFQIVKKLMTEKGFSNFNEIREAITFREFVENVSEEILIEKTAVEDSVRENISLYLSTKPGEYTFDPQYGCIVHNYDFRQINDTPSKDQLKRSVGDYLQKFEKRITVNNISIEINDVQEAIDGSMPRICRYITISISCTLRQTQQPLKEMKFRLVRYS